MKAQPANRRGFHNDSRERRRRNRLASRKHRRGLSDRRLPALPKGVSLPLGHDLDLSSADDGQRLRRMFT